MIPIWLIVFGVVSVVQSIIDIGKRCFGKKKKDSEGEDSEGGRVSTSFLYTFFVFLSACLPFCLSVCLSVCLCVCLSVCVSVSLPACLPAFFFYVCNHLMMHHRTLESMLTVLAAVWRVCSLSSSSFG